MFEVNDFIGRVLNGTYRIEGIIGRGSMGVVLRATHTRLGRALAVKLLNPSVSGNQTAIQRLEREARICCALGNPHIIEIVDFDRDADGVPFIVMELLDGVGLDRCLEQANGPLALPLIHSVIVQATSALQAAHDAGVVHRDLKPQNLFLCRRGGRDDYLKVLDFGISRVAGAAPLTAAHALLGTPGYMSPEQASGIAAESDARADIFALGVIAYELLTCQRPFTGASMADLLFNIVHQPAPPLRTLRADLPARVEEVVLWALSKDPDARPQTMRELGEAFDRAVGPATGVSPDVSTSAPDVSTSATTALVDRPADTPASAPRLPTVADTDAIPLPGEETGADEQAKRTTRRPSKERVRIVLLLAILLVVAGGGAVIGWLSGEPQPAPAATATSTARSIEAFAKTATPIRDSTVQDARADLIGADAASPDTSASTDTSEQPGSDSDSADSARPSTARPPPASTARPRRPRSPGHGTLRVVTKLDGRSVWSDVQVDGRPAGRSPLSLRLREGWHRVSTRRGAYRAGPRRVRIGRGQIRTLILQLEGS